MKKICLESHVMMDNIEQVNENLEDMDEAGIDMQVLSCIFPNDARMDAAQSIQKAQKINDTLAGVVRRYPDRFGAFAVLPLQDPAAAAAELERAVTELGLKGTLIFSSIGGEYLDNEKFRIILERAQDLNMPVYLHPAHPSADMIKPFMTYPVLSGSMWGFSVEAGLHAMRLICSGTFDRYPRLNIILGHMGEGIPYWLWRIDDRWTKEKDGGPGSSGPDPVASRLLKKPSQYFRDNFHITTSGMFWPPALQFANSVLGADRILFSVDYGPGGKEEAVKAARFIEAAPISDEDKEKICHLNTEKLLRMN